MLFDCVVICGLLGGVQAIQMIFFLDHWLLFR